MASEPMKLNGGTCPSLETIGAFVDGRFKDREREVIADHLASCETCYFVFSEAARTRVTAQPQAEVVPFAPRRLTWRIASGLAVAASLVLAVNVWRSTGLTHSWFLTQVKPDTPQEARIDQLMDVILGAHDLGERQKAYKEVETIANDQRG